MASGDRIHRLVRLVAILQTGRRLNSAQLAEECGVSRRTIFRDLRTLQESGIPIHYDEAGEGYSLPHPVYVPSLDFTLNEALALVVLATTLSDPQTGVPFQRDACSAAHKLLSNLPSRIRDMLGDITPRIDVELEPHNTLAGLGPIYNAMMESIGTRRHVRITYQSLMPDEPQEFLTLLSPYRLFFGRRSWYVIGRSSLHREVRTFNLGRIRHAELIDSQYTIPKRFTLERYLGDAWFLIRERNKRRKVVVRFQPMVARNVAEVVWHKTQKLVWRKDGTLDFHATVDGLREIQWWILGYGDQAEVLRPKELREQIRRRIEQLHKSYQHDGQSARASRRTSKQKRKRSGRSTGATAGKRKRSQQTGTKRSGKRNRKSQPKKTGNRQKRR